MANSRTGTSNFRFGPKRKERSLLATLRSLGRGLSREEAVEIHRLLKIDHLVDSKPETVLGAETLVFRGANLLEEEKKLKLEWESFKSYVSAGDDAARNAKWADEKAWGVSPDYKVPQGFVKIPPGDRKGLFDQALAELLVSVGAGGYPPRSRQKKLLGGHIPSSRGDYDEFIRLFRRSKKV